MLRQRRNQHINIYTRRMKYEEHAKIFSETEQLPENLKRIKVKKNPVQLEPENKQNFKRLYISIAPT